ncbi:DUF6428 family protein [uncultured Winogradskyella sp.]|mgnify:FL=1|uniref:DUF6428 family protein n=1 Tax=uncultured Winogradskyella sp. TaxID=395353 RepID=UPI0030D8537E|tara:strand:- start:42253 stop:42723 length:471 start_codon:yes stop_codon:yes gene_type:complete
MKLKEIKTILTEIKTIAFQLPDGSLVPNHFHVTEVGKISKDFIDCGGTVRHEQVANFQLWEANDYDHRLHPEKLLDIIELSEKILKIGNLDIEVEYQSQTIGKYDLEFNGKTFLLTPKQTACLALSSCGLPNDKLKVKISEIQKTTSGCTPNSGCC